MCSFGTFNGCHSNRSQELIKNRKKMLIFVICVIFKCDLSPINRPQGIIWLLRNSLLFSWSIHANVIWSKYFEVGAQILFVLLGILLTYLLVFFRLFEHAEQRSFVPLIMMIECNFTYSNKKTNMDKNYIQRNSWTFGSPAGQKIWETKFINLCIAPPKRKHCGTALDPPLWACCGDVTMLPLLFCYGHTIEQMRMTQLH